MNKLSARQIVTRLLEYGVNYDAPGPGSPDDPWRQSLGPLPKMDFTAVRPGTVPVEFPEDEDEEEGNVSIEDQRPPPPPAASGELGPEEEPPPGPPSRFNWKPPIG